MILSFIFQPSLISKNGTIPPSCFTSVFIVKSLTVGYCSEQRIIFLLEDPNYHSYLGHRVHACASKIKLSPSIPIDTRKYSSKAQFRRALRLSDTAHQSKLSCSFSSEQFWIMLLCTDLREVAFCKIYAILFISAIIEELLSVQ